MMGQFEKSSFFRRSSHNHSKTGRMENSLNEGLQEDADTRRAQCQNEVEDQHDYTGCM